MPVYIARQPGTTGIDGIFWATNANALFWSVDEEVDPYCFEYARLKNPGGLYCREDPKALTQFDGTDADEYMPEPEIRFDTICGSTEKILRQNELSWFVFEETGRGGGKMLVAVKEDA